MIGPTDLPRLKWPLLAVALAISVAGGLVWLVDTQRSQELSALADAQRAYREAHARYIGAQRDEDLLRDVLGRFSMLELRGQVGDERRLDWVERIRNARTSAGLAQLDFELRPRRPLGQADGGPLEMTASTLHLSTSVRHGGKLLRFLDTILEERSATPRIDRCSMKRRAGEGSENALEVACNLDWITIRKKDAGQ